MRRGERLRVIGFSEKLWVEKDKKKKQIEEEH